MAFMAIIWGLGLLFYILLGFRLGFSLSLLELGLGSLGFRVWVRPWGLISGRGPQQACSKKGFEFEVLGLSGLHRD